MTDLTTVFKAFLAGDNAAFSALYRELNPRLSAYCHKLSPINADDLMQELWEQVIAMRNSSSAKNRGVVNPAAFLFRMLKNLAIDEYRGSRALQGTVVSLEDTPWAEAHGYDNHDNTSSEIEAIILESLEKLPKKDREVLILNIYSGYNYSEIAEMLSKSVEAIWQRASRARAKLRTIVLEDAKRMGIALPKMNGSINPKKIEAKV